MLNLRSDGKGALLAESHAAVGVEDALIPACIHMDQSCSNGGIEYAACVHTLDDTADANGSVEVSWTGGGGVELAALVVGLVGIEDPSSVLHADGIALLGTSLAIAGRDQLLGDTHGGGGGLAKLWVFLGLVEEVEEVD